MRLTEIIEYGSAGTIEYIVDQETALNDCLQFEHGGAKLCYNIDSVQQMLKQADAQLSAQEGLQVSYLTVSNRPYVEA